MTDRAQLTASLEDYVEAIFHIAHKQGAARVTDIATEIGVAKSSVTGALKSLSSKGLVNYDPYSVITLTGEGEEIAGRVVRRHEVLEKFLCEVLGLPSETARANACRLEHAVEPAVVDRLLTFIDYIEESPRAGVTFMEGFAEFCSGEGAGPASRERADGAPGRRTGSDKQYSEGEKGRKPAMKIKEIDTQPLSAVEEDVPLKMVSAECGKGLCARLASMGLRPGTRFRVVRSSGPGPLVVAIGHARLGLGRSLAHKIMVRADAGVSE